LNYHDSLKEFKEKTAQKGNQEGEENAWKSRLSKISSW
jgi:hypothetical protein